MERVSTEGRALASFAVIAESVILLLIIIIIIIIMTLLILR